MGTVAGPIGRAARRYSHGSWRPREDGADYVVVYLARKAEFMPSGDPPIGGGPHTMARSGGNAFFSNFASYDAPFATKVRLALANSWRKMRTGSSCCGNLGQPGC